MTEPMERALIERECERLIVAYSHYIDFGDAARVAELFTDDGVWQSPEARLDGRAAIHTAFTRRQANPGRRSRHVCTNVAVDVVSSDEARGVCYFTLWRADGVERTVARVDGPEMVGEYRDTFVLTPNGWRIRERRASVGFQRLPPPD
jgi:ketosteroid isomerase-like protein